MSEVLYGLQLSDITTESKNNKMPFSFYSPFGERVKNDHTSAQASIMSVFSKSPEVGLCKRSEQICQFLD